MKQLKYWRDLPKSKKQELKAKHNVKVVSFEFIEKVYSENIMRKT